MGQDWPKAVSSSTGITHNLWGLPEAVSSRAMVWILAPTFVRKRGKCGGGLPGSP